MEYGVASWEYQIWTGDMHSKNVARIAVDTSMYREANQYVKMMDKRPKTRDGILTEISESPNNPIQKNINT